MPKSSFIRKIKLHENEIDIRIKIQEVRSFNYRKFHSALGLTVIDRVPISILLQVCDTVKLDLSEVSKKFIFS